MKKELSGSYTIEAAVVMMVICLTLVGIVGLAVRLYEQTNETEQRQIEYSITYPVKTVQGLLRIAGETGEET